MFVISVIFSNKKIIVDITTSHHLLYALMFIIKKKLFLIVITEYCSIIEIICEVLQSIRNNTIVKKLIHPTEVIYFC